ncbi:MAG: hypothetical protein QF793_00940 [Candidatus Peribacteraceae bacterium]|jgi:hypothetical protein|nr:hypothetical protein [Candidatus Peribacteraceae bacterium]
MSLRNSRNLYSRTCDLTGENIVTIYAPEKPFKVYKREEWFGDKWDATEYGRDFDFTRPFFQQYKELQLEVPRCALLNVNPENSEYCNMCVDNKNCYLVFGGDYNEDAMYCTMNIRNRDVVDIDYSNTNESSYWLFNAHDCYGTQFAFDSSNCNDCAFMSNCTGCTDCILCTNLKNKTHCIRNQQLSKEQYQEEKKKLLNGTHSQQQKNVTEHMEQRRAAIVRDQHVLACEDCSGDYLTHSKGCVNCYFTWDSEDQTNVILSDHANNCFNCSYTGNGTEHCYNQVATIGGKECRFSYFTIDSYHAEYCETINNCKYIFGCIGLRHKEYCIFNKQYSKEQYQELREKIISHMKETGEWGKLFPKELSCFAYNESTAHEYMPLSKKQAIQEGFSWKDDIDQPVEAEKFIPAAKLPDAIDDIPEDILNWAIQCEQTNKPFKIQKQELAFYRTHRIPIPHLHPNERFRSRMALMNPCVLFDRTCEKCKKPIQTTYSPDRSETVYCEECYLKEVY